MSLSCVMLFILLLCCLNTLQEVAGRKEKLASKKGEIASYAQSGLLSTKDKHACSWKINGDQFVSLVVSCTQQDNSSYECTYEGEPWRCPAYSTKAKHYWKQIFWRIKKTTNACEEKTLRSRLCKKALAVDSQLTLVQKEAGAMAEKEQGKGRKRGRPKETEKVPEPTAKDLAENVGHRTEPRGKAGKREPKSKTNQNLNPSNPPPTNLSTTAREVNDEMSEFREDLTEAYCAEKWHSLCSFFVGFWNG